MGNEITSGPLLKESEKAAIDIVHPLRAAKKPQISGLVQNVVVLAFGIIAVLAFLVLDSVELPSLRCRRLVRHLLENNDNEEEEARDAETDRDIIMPPEVPLGRLQDNFYFQRIAKRQSLVEIKIKICT